MISSLDIDVLRTKWVVVIVIDTCIDLENAVRFAALWSLKLVRY